MNYLLLILGICMVIVAVVLFVLDTKKSRNEIRELERANAQTEALIEELNELSSIIVDEMDKRYNNMLDIYNPFSILNALSKKILADYWFRTGSPTYLVRLLSHFDENINEMVNSFYPTSSFIDYKADVEAPLPMIYQSGYLTIKDWNMDTDSYLLDFPNDEVRSGFLTLVKAAKRR